MAPAFSYSATQAIAAVASGFCHTALALRVIGQQPSSSALVKGAGANHPMTSMLHRAAGDRQFLVPFGAGSPVQWAGMFTQRLHVSNTARPRRTSAATWSPSGTTRR